MKRFDVPYFYKSSFISNLKNLRKLDDPKKSDFDPAVIDFGPVRILLARHFGFCYGVENAIEIVYKTIENNPGRNIFLLSEMIHNPGVNSDLQNLGVRFLMDTAGKQIIEWDELSENDLVIIPAFGTTLEIESILKEKKIDPYLFDTTCPFVEKVWNRSSSLGNDNFTVVIHGKHYHEETRATFSHSRKTAPSLIVKDIEEVKFLGSIILNETKEEGFYNFFGDKFSIGFDVKKDLIRIGVVNQTTMLATETQEIVDYLRKVMIKKYGMENINEHFADTRDTLCYATNDNQEATYGLLRKEADLAIVVGGYNSSNTGHIVELCQENLPTYFISSEKKIINSMRISHFDIQTKEEKITNNFLPLKDKINIALTSGASCPDATVEAVLRKLVSFFDIARSVEEVFGEVISKFNAE